MNYLKKDTLLIKNSIGLQVFVGENTVFPMDDTRCIPRQGKHLGEIAGFISGWARINSSVYPDIHILEWNMVFFSP